MKSTEMLSRILVSIVCLLLFDVSILSSLLFPQSLSTAVLASSSSEATQDTIPEILYQKNEKDNSPSNPFESIWKTFKDVIDSTTNVLSSSLSSSGSASSHEDDHSVIQSDREMRDAIMNRRGLLLEQSLNDHYTHQFFNFFPELKEYATIVEEENLILDKKESSKKSRTQASPANSGILRWVQADPVDGSTLCYCFSESPGSFWSFQLCPEKGSIYQGRRMNDGKIIPSYNLGTRLSSPNGVKSKEKENTRYLETTAIAKYPSAVGIHTYVGGDTCVESGSQRRASVVILHGTASAKCDSGKDEIFLESVVEARVCQYMLHVCLDSWNESQLLKKAVDSSQSEKDDGEEDSVSPIKQRTDLITEYGFRELNQTLQYIKNHIIGSFARKSREDARGKSRESILTSLHSALPPFPQTRREANLKLIEDMFIHAYDSYMYHGYPASEVKPISCGPASFNLVKIPGLTLIDSLDTLVILGNYTEFARAVERLRFLNNNVYEETGIYTAGSGLFDINYNVSVFETNIRVLGGLLSAHQLATAFLEGKVLEKEVWAEDKSILLGVHQEIEDCQEGESKSGCDTTSTTLQCKQESFPRKACHNNTDKYWVYDDFLLELAQDIGDRLLPAFDTKTGIPYGTVNLISGIPKGETPVASLAGGGTLSLEMELLSRLTGNNEYGRAAKLATRALWMRRSTRGLLGKHICTRSGLWTESLSGIGSNSDSFYEYLIKHHILFPEDSDFWLQLVAAYGGVHNDTRVGEWYGDVEMRRGKKQKGVPRRVFEALMAFYPGMQVLLGEITPAARTLNSFFLVREYLGFLPERFDFGSWKVDHGGGIHLLRPELLESAYFLHRASKGFQNQFRPGLNNYTSDTSGWVWSGDFALHAIEKLTRTECGYGSVLGVSPKTSGKLKADRNRIRLMDEMPSYFLSETLKYLYLLFDDKNILHMDEDHDWVFTTEAHPIHNEQKEVSDDTTLMQQARELKSRIQRRLAKQRKPRNDLDAALLEEKWTEESKARDFGDQLQPLMTNDVKLYENRRRLEAHYAEHDTLFSTAVERIFPRDIGLSPFDVYNERFRTLNPTYLCFRKLGNEVDLTNSCPNVYASNFLWIRALNGGIADYSDSFKSRTEDDFLVSESDIIQLGSVDALALHGAGVHIQSLYDAFYQKRHPVQDTGRGDDKKPRSVSKSTEKGEDNRNGVTRFDMGDGLGSFDVSAFPGGSGFFVQHVESGETMVTTLIEEEPSLDRQGPLVLVYSTSDTGSQVTDNSRDSSILDRGPRAVVLADIHGNSYSCQIQITESEMKVEEDSTCDARASSSAECIAAKRRAKILHQFPCSPALFGPTHTSHLQKVKSIQVEAKIMSPDANDNHGCGRFSMSLAWEGSGKESDAPEAASSHSNVANDEEPSVISLVHRGDCTFQEKAFNKKRTNGSKGVIVVNSNKGDDLFVMSGGGSEEIGSLDREDYPVTVLITWDDGQKILKTIRAQQSKSGGESQISATISLVHDQVPDDTEVKDSTSKFWPRVRAGPDALQIYSRSGWGVHAVQVITDSETEAQWQLYLLQHGMVEEAVP